MEATTAQARVGTSPHDATASPIGSEFILPVQYFGEIIQGPTRRSDDCCELRLMFAVLEDAIAIYQKITPDHPKGGPQSRAFREVEEWIKSNDLVWPFSFRNLCYALHFDPDYLREGLMRWRTTHKGSAPRTTRSRRIAGMPRTQVAKARPRRTRKAAR